MIRIGFWLAYLLGTPRKVYLDGKAIEAYEFLGKLWLSWSD